MKKPPTLVAKNLLNTIHGVVGSKLFQHLYLLDDSGQETDVYKGGQRSCAYVVSGVLVLNDLMERVRATVHSCLADMESMGWYKTDKPVPGSVIHWPADESGHEHVGFYLDDQTAMSNSDTLCVPELHGIVRKNLQPIAYFTHPDLQI
ncbi:MAG TPA: hypothetical protein V6C65_31595 [Allocoleopsis sp.]